MNSRTSLLVVLAVVASSPDVAAGAPTTRMEIPDYQAERTEIGIVPLIGGDSDFGVAVGTLMSVARFHEGAVPYLWRTEINALASFKHDGGGVHNTFQDYYAKITLPSLFANQLRMTMRAAFTRYTLLNYYGLGNATKAPTPWSQYPADSPDYLAARDFSTYALTYPHGTLEFLVKLAEPVQLRLAADYFYEHAVVRPGSKLDQDFNSADKAIAGNLHGRGDYGIGLFTTGLVWDTRDNETAPVSGSHSTVAVRYSPGKAIDSAYTFGGTYVSIRNYLPIWDRALSLATRVAGDVLFGDVPFFMLAETEDGYAVGGGRGVRGVPAQRYYGKVKAYANLELRSEFASFDAFDQECRFGAVAFYDVGRVWAEAKYNPRLDGTGWGLKYGVGGGIRFQVGETFLLRVDGAWSPDANPVAMYFNVGQAF